MNGSAYVDGGLSLHGLALDSAAEGMAEIVDEEPGSSLMDEEYAEKEDDDELEEAWSEEDERPTQYDLRQYGVYQSLPIPAGPPDLQSDCTTAEEYIKRVRYEAELLPQTVTSHIDPRDFDAQRTDYVPLQDQDTVTAADCIPSRQWFTEFLADFANLRAQLYKEEEDFDPFLPRPPPPPPPHPLPHFRDKNGWQRYCLGAPHPQQPQQQQQQQQQQHQQPSNLTADADTSAQQMDSQQQLTQGQQQLIQGQPQQVPQAQQQLAQRQHMAQVSEHPGGMLTSPEAPPPPPPASASNAFNTQPSIDCLADGQHVADANNAAMDHNGSSSGNFSTIAVSSMAEAAGQMPEAGMLSDSMLGDVQDGDAQDGDAQDVAANGMPGDTAEAMLGDDGAAQDVEANSMSAESEIQSTPSGSSEAAADGHPPQMAVLASLDQVTINYLLQWHVNWAVTSATISELSMRWLYALMAHIEKPIASESSSQLSKLLRHCVGVRKTIDDDNDARLLSIHMLIALAGGYFGQDGTLAACMQPGWV